MRRIPWFPILALVSACATGDDSTRGPGRPVRHPNIVIVLADDLGYGDPGCYNDESKIHTPNIDRLAQEGMRFTDAHSPSSVCTPTRYGLLTGRYAWRTGLDHGVLWPWDPPLIEPGRQTLPAMLHAVGYRTACVGKWHLGWDWPLVGGGYVGDEPHTPLHLEIAERAEIQARIDFLRPVRGGPLACGFDHFFGDDAPNFPPYAFIEDDRLTAQPTAQNDADFFGYDGPMVPGWDLSVVLPAITQHAASFIDEQVRHDRDQPFFLYLALTAPHVPIAPSIRWAGTSGAGAYGDWVAETDWALGVILDTLERNAIADDTLVIFTSDNGSPQRDGHLLAGEVGSAKERFGHDSSRPWRGLKGDIWEGGHRVPFLARWSGVIPAATTSAEPLELTDLYRTLATMVDTRVPHDAAEDSFDLADVFRGRAHAEPVRDHLVLHSHKGVFAIRESNWKLILGKDSGGLSAWEPPADAPEGQLYDLTADPTESTNLYAPHPEIVERLAARLDRLRQLGRSAPAD